MLLLLFVVICGIHLAGIHHDSDVGGLALADRLGVILLAAAFALLLVAVRRRWRFDCSSQSSRQRIFAEVLAAESSAPMVVPLRI